MRLKQQLRFASAFLTILTLATCLLFFPIYKNSKATETSALCKNTRELIVRLKTNANTQFKKNQKDSMTMVSICTRFNARLIDETGNAQKYYLLEFPYDSETAMQLLASDPRIKYAEPNFLYETCVTFNDPLYKKQERDLNTIQSPQALDIKETTSVPVIIVDTGMDITHSDLNVLPGGRDTVKNTNDVFETDLEHGTHVAGFGAKSNNNTGISGVVSGVPLLPIKISTDDGLLSVFGAISGIYYYLNNWPGQKAVFNFSWGGYQDSQALANVIQEASDAGMLFVAAAGNQSSNNDEKHFYPADNPGVISVGAYDTEIREPAHFSNYGQSVDLFAPGSEVLTTSRNNRYKTVSGTSFAAPQVAMAAALIMGRGYTNQQAMEILCMSAKQTEELKDKSGHGLLNMRDAIMLTRNVSDADAGSSIELKRGQKALLVGSVNDPNALSKSFVWEFDNKIKEGRELEYKAKEVGYHSITLRVRDGIQESISTTSILVTDITTIQKAKIKWNKSKFVVKVMSSKINTQHPLSTIKLIIMDAPTRRILSISSFPSSIEGNTYTFSGKDNNGLFTSTLLIKAVSDYYGTDYVLRNQN